MKEMPYQQVKERVEREDKVLKKLVIETGIGMLAALLLTLFFLYNENRILKQRQNFVPNLPTY